MSEQTLKHVAADIAKELREHPERWTRGADARDSQGNKVHPLSDDAVCWCLEGHIWRRLPHNFAAARDFAKAVDIPCLWQWNDDDPDRTVQEIIDICDRVAK